MNALVFSYINIKCDILFAKGVKNQAGQRPHSAKYNFSLNNQSHLNSQYKYTLNDNERIKQSK